MREISDPSKKFEPAVRMDFLSCQDKNFYPEGTGGGGGRGGREERES